MADKDKIKQDLEQIQEELEKDLQDTTEDVKESKGFLTSKGKFLSRPEWHAAVLGFTPIGIGYLLPSPIGELFVVAELMMLRTGFNKKMRGEKIEGHLGDVMDEIAYTFGFSFLAVLIFTWIQLQYGVGGLTSLDLSGLLVTMLGGA